MGEILDLFENNTEFIDYEDNSTITIEKHNGILVLRDDLLAGGTKSILMPMIINKKNEFVYASPVYGGFQIALSAYCLKVGKKATIFCAKRKLLHQNTQACIDLGAKVMQIPYGYLSVIEKHAKDYCKKNSAEKLIFGAKDIKYRKVIANRVNQVISRLGFEPDEIWCAIGSGTLIESILMATKTAKVYGVQVGAECNLKHDRLTILKYHKGFDKVSDFKANFKSTANYDLKAFEYCSLHKKSTGSVLFWNVY